MVQRCHEVQAAELVLVQAGQSHTGLDGLIDGPTPASDTDEGGERTYTGR
jgi:hypothetical protein